MNWKESKSLSLAYIYKDEPEFAGNLKYTLESLEKLSIDDNIELVILKDLNGHNALLDEEVGDLIWQYRHKNKFKINFYTDSFNNNFSEWKNKLFNICARDYILNLDADEHMRYDFFVKLFNDNYIIDDHSLMNIPRINIYNPALTEEDKNIARKWGWNFTNEFTAKDCVNFPDFQGRFYKNDGSVEWVGKVHERIFGKNNEFKSCALYPKSITDCIIHVKTFSKQIQQNSLYNSI